MTKASVVIADEFAVTEPVKSMSLKVALSLELNGVKRNVYVECIPTKDTEPTPAEARNTNKTENLNITPLQKSSAWEV